MTHKDVVSHTDISGESWVDRLPPGVVPYLKLMRLDRPIGIWLLLFPGWWGILLASGGISGLTAETLRLLTLFAVGAVLMRGAGCTINDLWDRDLDKQVARTRPRPLASGALSPQQGLAFLFFQLALSFGILLQLNGTTILLGFAALLPIALYPLMKRITWWPQLFLGLTFNWSVLMGWTAVTGKLDLPALLLYTACVFWTLGYDTIYAHQDKEDDLKIGIKSTALKLGKATKPWLFVFYMLFIGLITVLLSVPTGSYYAPALLALPAAHLLWQIVTLNIEDPENCLTRFKSNQVIGWLVLLAFMLA